MMRTMAILALLAVVAGCTPYPGVPIPGEPAVHAPGSTSRAPGNPYNY